MGSSSALETPQQEDEPLCMHHIDPLEDFENPSGDSPKNEGWIPAVTSLVTLILYPVLLLALYTMLSRKIAQHSCRMQVSSSPGEHPSGRSSDTSSDTSEDSDNDSPSCPQESINYTSLVFPGKGPEPGSAQDYENVKSGLDYVNVDPKKRKTHFWPFSSPRASKGVEYTEVKL
ncbi:regulator of hemoglobinization and erythroid cell expansion protein [Melozone crissalis]|uniref:regulator of hemoglobinization and erythroid cell expansion protein n=1 Tax=Melozone crissalis TaxID=40204 RepID=UPI0023DA9011|nr:regulator of hemoglobinization and erythroid cell expansion protein [Melozone crissalis]